MIAGWKGRLIAVLQLTSDKTMDTPTADAESDSATLTRIQFHTRPRDDQNTSTQRSERVNS